MTEQARRLLIVNADDFGLTTGVSQAILQAHRRGLVSSTSVLAIAPAFAATAPWLRDQPELGIGVHLAAVGEDPPLLGADEVPTIVDRRGRLPASWRRAVPALLAGRIDVDDLGREFDAQIARVRGAGLAVDHLDTHQHLHLLPAVGDLLVQLAERHGIGAVRVPQAGRRSAAAPAVNRLARRLRRAVEGAGLRTTDRFEGFDDRGDLTRDAVRRALGRAADDRVRSLEIGSHPGSADDPELARYRWGYSWWSELEVLTDPDLGLIVRGSGFELGTFRDL